MPAREKLFVYGTLRYGAVQRSTFGHTVPGAVDTLCSYKIEMITINDAHVVELSKETEHPMLKPTSNEEDCVDGMVLDLSPEELAQADSYEVDDYKRARVKLKSGTEAWAYVSARD